MRMWSLHPSHLDRAGLVAGWRETLLAQAVLADLTKGYKNHPQLERFRETSDPLLMVGAYLRGLHEESLARGYRFDGSKIMRTEHVTELIPVTDGQLAFEWAHLGSKLAHRSPEDAARWAESSPTPHPLFKVVSGGVAAWERV